jgi:hypothetical protein
VLLLLEVLPQQLGGVLPAHRQRQGDALLVDGDLVVLGAVAGQVVTSPLCRSARPA